MLIRNGTNKIHLQGLVDSGELTAGDPTPVDTPTVSARILAKDGTVIADQITLESAGGDTGGFPDNDYVGFWESADDLDDHEEAVVEITVSFTGATRISDASTSCPRDAAPGRPLPSDPAARLRGLRAAAPSGASG